MYNINSVVTYGTFGICKITAVEKRDFTGEYQEYYVLKQINNNKNVYYVPKNNDIALSKIHKISSKDEVNSLISYMNSESPIWIDDNTKRKEEYSKIIKSGNKKEIIKLIKAIYMRREKLETMGKKLHSLDDGYLNTA